MLEQKIIQSLHLLMITSLPKFTKHYYTAVWDHGQMAGPL